MENEKRLLAREFAQEIGCRVSCMRKRIWERRIAAVKVSHLVQVLSTERTRLISDGLSTALKQGGRHGLTSAAVRGQNAH
jgi:hypothetical protein